MYVVIGWLVVLACVIGSFIGIGGHVAALLQPYELLCIFGAALGAFVVSNPVKLLRAVGKAIPTCFQPSRYNKDTYLQLIALLFELLQKARMHGLLTLEGDVEDPKASPIFQRYPKVLGDEHVLDFIQDYLRMMVAGNTDVTGVEDLMNAELDTHHDEMTAPVNAIQRMADALPAFGIVAAVVGVVHTMGSVGQPPAVLGGLVAAALVGTFLGILLGYGFVGPLSSLLEAKAAEAAKPLECVKAILLASMNGYPPTAAIEFGRKVLYSVDRPSFVELEAAIATAKSGPVPPAEPGATASDSDAGSGAAEPTPEPAPA
jgi:chemotaxis protein MotA